ncbi:MAG TPA: hypothetical protein VGJ13_16475, partial [Pseudonocardiaceae bacterium]
MAEAMVSAWHAEVLTAWPELADRSLLARRLLDAQLLWTWLCTWWLLPMPHPRTSAAVPSLQPDSATTADRGGVLVDRWERLAAEAELVGRAETAGHASAVGEGLRRRFGIVGEALPRYPVFR